MEVLITIKADKLQYTAYMLLTVVLTDIVLLVGPVVSVESR